MPELSESVVCCRIFKDGSVAVGHGGFKERTSAEYSEANDVAFDYALYAWKKDHTRCEHRHNE